MREIAGCIDCIYKRGLLALPSDMNRAMREASNSRTVTDTDSYALLFYYSLNRLTGESAEQVILNMNSTVKKIILSSAVIAGLVVSSCGSHYEKAQVDLVPVKSGDSWGYVNLEGNYEINPQFTEADAFFKGRACVAKGDKCGYIDEKGTFVISPKYASATFFTEEGAWTVEPEGPPVLIDKDGKKLLVMKEAERVWAFSEGLALVETADGKYGYIDRNGKFVIEPTFDSGHPFSDGLAWVEEEYRSGYIDKNGKWVISDSTYQAKSSFINGRAIVENYAGEEGVIDKTGKFVINPQFSRMLPDGDRFIIKVGDEWGWCDAQGKIVINPQFSAIFFTGFGDSDMAPVKIGDEWGYIDRKGKIVINPQFGLATSFIQNKWAWVTKDGKSGLIDRKGNYVVNPQFKDVSMSYLASQNEDIFASTDELFVCSRYFNAEAVVEEVMKSVTQDAVYDVNFNMSIGDLMKKYGIDENRLGSYGSIQLKDFTITKDVDATLVVDGEFFELVSDGWWGMTNVLNKKAKPDKISLMLNMKGKAEGKRQQLSDAFAEKMKLKVLKDDDNYRFAEGTYGKFKVEIFEYYGGIDIRFKKK